MSRSAIRGACSSLTCGFAGRGERICALIRARRLGLPADGEDGVGRADSAGRVLLAVGVVGYRAPRVGADEAGRPSALVAGQGELDLGLGGAPSRRGWVRGAVTRCRLRCRGWGTCGMPSRTSAMIWASIAGGGRAEVFRAARAGSDHRAGQQARLPAGAGDRGQRAVVPDRAAAPARLCEGVMATAAGGNPHWLPARWKPGPCFG